MLKYTLLLRATDEDEEPGYSVIVPELPGCFTQGNTFEEAIEHAKEAILGYLEVLLADGEEIPIETKPYIMVPVDVPEPAALKTEASKATP